MGTRRFKATTHDRLAAHVDRGVQIERTRDALIDCDVVVADARDELAGAIARLRHAVRERDRIMGDLLEQLDAEVAA